MKIIYKQRLRSKTVPNIVALLGLSFHKAKIRISEQTTTLFVVFLVFFLKGFFFPNFLVSLRQVSANRRERLNLLYAIGQRKRELRLQNSSLNSASLSGGAGAIFEGINN